jgi:hypothetical protein
VVWGVIKVTNPQAAYQAKKYLPSSAKAATSTNSLLEWFAKHA